jgi:hypothetical protein
MPIGIRGILLRVIVDPNLQPQTSINKYYEPLMALSARDDGAIKPLVSSLFSSPTATGHSKLAQLYHGRGEHYGGNEAANIPGVYHDLGTRLSCRDIWTCITIVTSTYFEKTEKFA